ncbi:MAG: cupin domain-containing protein [Eubacterium sp.]
MRMNNRNAGTDDFGPEPFVVNIDRITEQNPFYRRTLWTGCHLQLTLMSIKPCGEIGLEVHPDDDQFLRLESGRGVVMMGPSRNRLAFQRRVGAGDAVFVPAGTWHNIVNTGNVPIKLYSIYAPPHHPHGTLHKTKEEADMMDD